MCRLHQNTKTYIYQVVQYRLGDFAVTVWARDKLIYHVFLENYTYLAYLHKQGQTEKIYFNVALKTFFYLWRIMLGIKPWKLIANCHPFRVLFHAYLVLFTHLMLSSYIKFHLEWCFKHHLSQVWTQTKKLIKIRPVYNC